MPHRSWLLYHVERTPNKKIAVDVRTTFGGRVPTARVDVACCHPAERLQR